MFLPTTRVQWIVERLRMIRMCVDYGSQYLNRKMAIYAAMIFQFMHHFCNIYFRPNYCRFYDTNVHKWRTVYSRTRNTRSSLSRVPSAHPLITLPGIKLAFFSSSVFYSHSQFLFPHLRTWCDCFCIIICVCCAGAINHEMTWKCQTQKLYICVFELQYYSLSS